MARPAEVSRSPMSASRISGPRSSGITACSPPRPVRPRRAQDDQNLPAGDTGSGAPEPHGPRSRTPVRRSLRPVRRRASCGYLAATDGSSTDRFRACGRRRPGNRASSAGRSIGRLSPRSGDDSSATTRMWLRASRRPRTEVCPAPRRIPRGRVRRARRARPHGIGGTSGNRVGDHIGSASGAGERDHRAPAFQAALHIGAGDLPAVDEQCRRGASRRPGRRRRGRATALRRPMSSPEPAADACGSARRRRRRTRRPHREARVFPARPHRSAVGSSPHRGGRRRY